MKAEIRFLQGPQSRIRDLCFLLITLLELIHIFRRLHFIGPSITFFGSTRFKEGHPYYDFTRDAAAQIAALGFTIMTGGGSGLMEAASRGAREAGGRSVGCNMQPDVKQLYNAYLDMRVETHNFFIRNILFVKYSDAFVIMPGGFETLAGCFGALALIRSGKVKNFPIIVFGTKYYKSFLEHLMVIKSAGIARNEDFKLLLITDDIGEALQFIRKHSINYNGLKLQQKTHPRSWLFEKKFPKSASIFSGAISFIKAWLWPD